MFLQRLPAPLEDVEALMQRRARAKQRKDQWRALYQDAQRYAVPARESFSEISEGAIKNNELYDTTLQDLTYSAANTMLAILFPPWARWAELTPGAAIDGKKLPPEVIEKLQVSTEAIFGYLHTSNFGTAIGEVALDLMIGTGALQFDEGDNENPFVFSSIPLSALELEEGPQGTIDSNFMCRMPQAQHLTRMYKGLEVFDLPDELAATILTNPTAKVSVIQCEVYYPANKHYYGIVIDEKSKTIIWRYDYGTSCPTIVGRASKAPGEVYGRGRVLLALSDAKTLDKMVEFMLKHAALQVAPPLTGVSDGVLNPYTAVLAPNVILPVASNDNGNPSLRALDIGGNFNITERILSDLREGMRRKMLGPDLSEGAIKSATEISVADRNRLWAMGGEFARIQYEILAKVVARAAFILRKRGEIPPITVDGREIAVKYTSPFAKSQASEDIMALQRTLAFATQLGPATVQMGLRTEEMPRWVARREGIDETLIRSDEEKKQMAETATQITEQATAAQAEGADPGVNETL